MITVRQIRSGIGRSAAHQACLRGLGIRRMHQVVQVKPTPENMGMVKKISYMLKVEE
ncbi:MAG: 50S ribosomal protein L30 [Methylococcus sp.]